MNIERKETMSEERTPYGEDLKDITALRDELRALSYQLTKGEELADCYMDTAPLVEVLGEHTRQGGKALSLDEAKDILKKRTKLTGLKKKIEDAGGWPSEDLAACHEALKRIEKTVESRRYKQNTLDAADLLTKAATERNEEEALELELRARDKLALRHGEEKPFNAAEVWEEHRAKLKAGAADSSEVVRLNEGRGWWGRWINANLGPRGGLEPGNIMLLGGGSGAGKTSIAACFVADALAAGVPCLVWEMELGQGELLGHIMAQCGKNEESWPKDWPRVEVAGLFDRSVNNIMEKMRAFAARERRRKKAENKGHACNGLVVVDYLQLCLLDEKLAKRIYASHEALETAFNMLMATAVEQGLVLIALSQFTKGAQREGTGGNAMAFAGADLMRPADSAFLLNRVSYEVKRRNTEAIKPITKDTEAEKLRMYFPRSRHGVARLPEYGAFHLIECVKTRGNCKDIFNKKDGIERFDDIPDSVMVFCEERAFHAQNRKEDKKPIEQVVMEKWLEQEKEKIGKDFTLEYEE